MIPEKTVGKLRQGWGSICFLLAPWWKYGKTLMVGSFISSVLFVPAAGYFSATLAQAVIEMIEAGKPFEAAFLTGLTYLLLALALNLLHAVYEDFYLRWKKQEIEGTIERSIYEKALTVDYRHFDDPSYFDSYKLTTEKFASQSSEMLQNLFSLLSGVAKCIVYGALIASQGVALLLIVLGCSAFVAYAQIYWSRVSVERETAMVNDQRKADYLRRLFFDHTAVADLRASNIKKPLFSLFDGSVKSRAAIYRKYGAKEFLTDILANLAQLGTTFAVPVYVAWGVMSGNIGGIGVYATLIASSLALKEALNALGWWSSQVALGVAYAQKVQHFFDTDSTIEASTDGEKASDGPFSVRFDHVSYRYGGSDDFAIRDLSLAIAQGEKIAIVGENGAGKTTLTKLLLRLYDADGGTVQINGRPIADYDVSTLRGRIGIAFQQSRLYALSVRENMTAYADADDARLKSCLEEVGLRLSLDAQVTKEFDENGAVLSGGDAQRLCLTRLLHSEFGLLILDEPSSALDPIAEYRIAKLIFDRSPTTTVMVAHRLSTVVDADRIYLLSDGRIIESGTHAELMAQNGKYREMFLKQAEGYLKA
ncbi:MAG: ABC transporter ATP-binding protein [Oscillibacter sp.]